MASAMQAPGRSRELLLYTYAMSRWLQAARITLYAVVLEIAVLSIALPAFVGREAMPRHIGFAAFLSILGAISVFCVVVLGLRHGPIDSAARGARLGLWAAGCFYLGLVFLFGALPSLPAVSEGRIGEAFEFLGTVLWAIAVGSYGLPIIIGVIGGAIYGYACAKK